ncbi:protein phosphatase 1 regulatory subunit 21 isoform X2 [Carcharodon carcharias]|uniref:protein phosphatase 1 regulatory subunit 21 isoform X2 n=1 Tax=Carcharodon carcharias TaxID=13397 RepID=UPI001B7DB404|nr:protein phosphatase 1 regulatory subunit 21 isoform X2 [Carcharodon carcharias]
MAADLQAKYQKLAQEYSKLRAQNQVLKKAVVDEQGQGTSLKEELKMKDQCVRKLQQEMDSLTFRNQQLAKRVELLQEELVTTEAKGKKNKKNADPPSQMNQQLQSVFDEDLQNKIEENERLHKQVQEAQEKHRQIETELRERLVVLERDTMQHHAVVDGLKQKYMDTIEKLQNDKANLEMIAVVGLEGGVEGALVKSHSLEREAKECRLRTEECQQQLKNIHADLSSRLDQSTSIIQEKIPFNDRRFAEYNTLDVPVHDRRHQLKARDLNGQALAFVRDLVGALLNLHTYTEQRIQIYPIDSATDTISPLNQKFSEYLHENAAYVRPLEEGMLHLFESITEETVTTLETTVKLKPFSDVFTSYVCFLKKILPYQLKSLEEECECSLCTANLQARNMELQSDMQKMTAAFEKLQVYISLLTLPSTTPEMLLQTNHNVVFTQLAACLHSLHDVMKDISKHYSQKVSLEQELPTITQKLKNTNDCILSSVVALSNVTGKVGTFFSNNLDFFTAPSVYGSRVGMGIIDPLAAECMLENKKKAAAYIKSLKKSCPGSVPYEEALANRRTILSSTESREGLSQQVQQSQEKIAKLEQEKEHWMLEAQLAKIKLEKENQRLTELESQLKTTFTGPVPSIGSIQENGAIAKIEELQLVERDSSEPVRCTSLVGMLTTSIINNEIPDAESREQLIKSHYMMRVAELTSQLQIADSKSVHFFAECRALVKRLALAEKSRETFSEEIKVANQNVVRLQDELTTTKRSYEDQLSMMSDHLCSMNETLSKQREEIDSLRMGSKGNAKKNRGR